MREIEKLSRNFDTKQRLRKTGLRAAAGIAGLTITLGAMHGVTLDPTPVPEYSAATPQERLELSRDGTSTVAHRAANTEKGIINAAKAGIDFADGDINKIENQLYLYHGTQVGGFLGVDVDTKSLKLGTPDLTIERAFQVAGEEGIDLFLEFKRGNFDEKDAKYIYELSQNHGVDIFLSSKDIEVVEMAQDAIGNPSVCLFNPYDKEDWNSFFGKSTINTIITTPYWIEKYQPELKQRETKVFVTGINSYSDAISMVSTGLVQGFMNEARILQEVFRNPRN